MKDLDIQLEHCYGIKKLQEKLDFTKKNTYLIYASNGTMKTSFTKTFYQIMNGKSPKDEAFKSRKAICNITSSSLQIRPEQIFVIHSFEEQYISSNSGKLMASPELKGKYDLVMTKVNMLKEGFISDIRKYTNSSMDVVAEFSNAFKCEHVNFLDKLLELFNNNILEQQSCGLNFSKVHFLDIFNPAIESFLSKPANLKNIREYNTYYDKIISQYPMFIRGEFSPHNIENITVSLDNNGFFKPDNNSIVLNGETHKFSSSQQLLDFISNIKSQIMSDEKIRDKFNKISEELEKRTKKDFRVIIEQYPEIILHLEDYEKFKKSAWTEILKNVSAQFKLLITSYLECKAIIDDIKKDAKKTATHWHKALEVFQNRFDIPVKITVPNIDDVLLNEVDPVIDLSFLDYDTDETTPMDRKTIETILSQGEKRAIYLLNIIYDLESLRNNEEEMLIVTDDISDSFDYKNKYAIIEYLQDYIRESNFKLIILTHNFDFFRTLFSRNLKEITPVMALRTKEGIKFNNDIKYIKSNPYICIKKDIQNNKKILIKHL